MDNYRQGHKEIELLYSCMIEQVQGSIHARVRKFPAVDFGDVFMSPNEISTKVTQLFDTAYKCYEA
jgi:hypothetical protein